MKQVDRRSEYEYEYETFATVISDMDSNDYVAIAIFQNRKTITIRLTNGIDFYFEGEIEKSQLNFHMTKSIQEENPDVVMLFRAAFLKEGEARLDIMKRDKSPISIKTPPVFKTSVYISA